MENWVTVRKMSGPTNRELAVAACCLRMDNEDKRPPAEKVRIRTFANGAKDAAPRKFKPNGRSSRGFLRMADMRLIKRTYEHEDYRDGKTEPLLLANRPGTQRQARPSPFLVALLAGGDDLGRQLSGDYLVASLKGVFCSGLWTPARSSLNRARAFPGSRWLASPVGRRHTRG
jgi:hypothetical protein